MNVNTINLVGRLANDPQLKPYKRQDGTEGYRCFFRLAVTRLMDRGKPRGEQRASFIPVVAWGEAAKRHAQYLAKGTEVAVTGELIVESNKLADGSFGPDFVNVNARDIQYGQASIKNAPVETLQNRLAAIQARIGEMHASGAPPMAAGEVPGASALPPGGVNPFTPDGSAPSPAPASA